MDITQIDEQWVELDRSYLSHVKPDTIVRVSNTGKYQKMNGSIGLSWLRQAIRTSFGRVRIHRIIADYFLITVKRPDQKFVDHITHYPTEYNVNDIRNLRYCTNKENCNFEEAKNNKSGYTRERATHWKGDNAGDEAKYHWALKDYQANPTEENLAALKEARLRWNEYRRHLRRDKKSLQ